MKVTTRRNGCHKMLFFWITLGNCGHLTARVKGRRSPSCANRCLQAFRLAAQCRFTSSSGIGLKLGDR